MNRARLFSLEFPLEFCALPAPSPRLQACVIIPARDEAAHLCATLDALAAQRTLTNQPFEAHAFEIILLANNCRDATAAVARAWGRAHPAVALHVVEVQFAAHDACVGHARRALMNAACSRLSEGKSDGPRAICSTDADTRVAPLWLAHTLEAVRAGAAAVGGRILLARAPGDQATRATYLRDTAYRLACARLESRLDPNPGDQWPRHFQFFGASLAIRPDVYACIGGLPRARCLEDVALEAELVRRDFTVRHAPGVVALTSARRVGRVETGLSTQLKEWANLEDGWLVAPGAQIAWQARLKSRLRAQFAGPRDIYEINDIARELMICRADLDAALGQSEFFGELWIQLWEFAWINSALQARFAPVPVEIALKQLRAILLGETI